MSERTPSGSLGPATIIAALLLLLGAGAYVAMTQADDDAAFPTAGPHRAPLDPAPAADPTAKEGLVEAEPPADSESETPSGPAQAALPVPGATVLDMASGPKVTPDTHSARILSSLGEALPKLQACAAEWVARNPKQTAKAFFVFTVDDAGHPSAMTLQFKGMRNEDVDACFTSIVGRLELPGPGSKVFWPVTVGGAAVVAPLGASE